MDLLEFKRLAVELLVEQTLLGMAEEPGDRDWLREKFFANGAIMSEITSRAMEKLENDISFEEYFTAMQLQFFFGEENAIA